jgi:hypothetical protein
LILDTKNEERRPMRTFSVFVIALAMGTGLGATLESRSKEVVARAGMDTSAAIVAGANNAAFRDGLYQAKLSVERGRGVHIATGRWASDEDRVSFAAGYQQGYAQSLDRKHATGGAPRA